MDERLKRFYVFGLSRNQQSQKHWDSQRRLDDRSFLQLKQYKHEFIRTPSITNTCQTQMKKLRLKHQTQINQNQQLSYSLSIQNFEQLPNRSLDPKVIKLVLPNHKKNTQSQKEGLTTTRNHYNNYFAHHEQNENNRTSFPSLKFKNKIVKSQFLANLQFYKKQQSIPFQVKPANQDDIKRGFESIRNKYVKSRTELENYAELNKPNLKSSKSKFHLSQKRNENQNKNNINNNSVQQNAPYYIRSQKNLDIDFLEDLQKYDKNNCNQVRIKVIEKA